MNCVFELLSGCYDVLNALSSQRRAEHGGDSCVQKFFPAAIKAQDVWREPQNFSNKESCCSTERNINKNEYTIATFVRARINHDHWLSRQANQALPYIRKTLDVNRTDTSLN